jgi:hypothetical protein
MRTRSGKESLLETGALDPMDLVIHLGRARRFGGAGDDDWTVLHHSVLVALIWMRLKFPEAGLRYALTHDFHEAVTGDIPGPVKRALGEEGRRSLSALEWRIDRGVLSWLKTPNDGTDERNHLEHNSKTWWLAQKVDRSLGQTSGTTEHQLKICDRIALLVEMIEVGPRGSLYDEVRDILGDNAGGENTIDTLARVVRTLHEIHPTYGCTVSATAVTILPYPERDKVLICRCNVGDGLCDMNLDPEKRTPPAKETPQ